VTARLYNHDGNLVSESSIDLPNEHSVSGITYDNTTKQLKIMFLDGSYVMVSIASLVDQLVTSDTFNAHTSDTDVHISPSERSAWNSHLIDSDSHVTPTEKNAWNAKYVKPGTGIPLDDLSEYVQTGIGYAYNSLTFDELVTA